MSETVNRATVKLTSNHGGAYYTSKNFGFTSVAYKGFDAEQVFPPGSNLNFFAHRSQETSVYTWALLQFHLFRTLLTVVHWLMSLYYQLPPWMLMALHETVRAIGNRSVARGAMQISVRSGLSHRLALILSGVSARTRFICARPQFRALVQRVSNFLSTEAVQGTYQSVAQHWLLSSETYVQLRTTVLTVLAKHSDSLEELFQPLQSRNLSANVGVVVKYQQYSGRPMPVAPRVLKLASGQERKPTVEEMLEYEHALAECQAHEHQHHDREVRRLMHEVSEFIASASVARLSSLVIYDDSGVVAANMQMLGGMLSKYLRAVDAAMAPSTVNLRVMSCTMDSLVLESVATSGQLPPVLPSRTLCIYKGGMGELDVTVVTRDGDVTGFMEVVRRIAQTGLDSVTSERMMEMLCQRLVGVSTLDMLVLPDGHTYGLPCYLLTGTFVYSQSPTECIGSTPALFSSALKAYCEVRE